MLIPWEEPVRALTYAVTLALAASGLLGDGTDVGPGSPPVLTAAVVSPAALLPLPPPPPLPPLKEPVWVCKPGMPRNACGQDADGNPTDRALTGRYDDGYSTPLDATAVAADGSKTTEPLPARSDPPVDCFYVYPTVDVVSNPLLRIGSNPPKRLDNEIAVTLTQIARFAGHCRVYAPLYRQSTLLDGITAVLAPPDTATGYEDVRQAFLQYWNHDNIDRSTGKRRGIVFIGHSQGVGMVAKLVTELFDGKPAADQLVGLYLPGGDVTVPLGKTDGGGGDPVSTFQHIPVCTRDSADDPIPTGCVTGYASYHRDPSVPPDGGTGTAPDPQHERICINPAAILAGDAPDARTQIHAYLPTRRLLRGTALAPDGGLTLLFADYRAPDYPTGFFTLPGQVTGQCYSAIGRQGRLTWLQVDGLEKIAQSNAVLGLHVFDMNVASGDLLNLIRAQSKEWAAHH
jgi:hypothetical protein